MTTTHQVNFHLLDLQRAALREVIELLESQHSRDGQQIEHLHGINHLLDEIADTAFHLDVRKTPAVGIKVVTSMTPYESKS